MVVENFKTGLKALGGNIVAALFSLIPTALIVLLTTPMQKSIGVQVTVWLLLLIISIWMQGFVYNWLFGWE